MAYDDGGDRSESFAATWPELATDNSSILRDSAFWMMCGAVVLLMGCLVGWQTPLTLVAGQTDEELHFTVSAAITQSVAQTTGSLALGRDVANLLGVAKEGFDVLTGEGVSRDDLDADEAGRYSIY